MYAPHTSDLLRIGFTIIENSLSRYLEDDLLSMPGHASFSIGASDYSNLTTPHKKATELVCTYAIISHYSHAVFLRSLIHCMYCLYVLILLTGRAKYLTAL